MLNEDLLSAEEKKIARLTTTIERFKKYDAERKEYLRELEVKLQDMTYYCDDLRAMIVEDDPSGTLQNLLDQNKKQRETIKQMKLQNSVHNGINSPDMNNAKANVLATAEAYASLQQALKGKGEAQAEVARLAERNRNQRVQIMSLERKLYGLHKDQPIRDVELLTNDKATLVNIIQLTVSIQ